MGHTLPQRLMQHSRRSRKTTCMGLIPEDIDDIELSGSSSVVQLIDLFPLQLPWGYVHGSNDRKLRMTRKEGLAQPSLASVPWKLARFIS